MTPHRLSKLSTIVFKKTENIISACVNHPFNQEMKLGVLPQNKFFYYLEQDKPFLRSFGKALENTAAKFNNHISDILLEHSKHCFAAEETILCKIPEFSLTNKLTHATHSLNNFLLESSNKSLEVALAAILPCFWIYLFVGKDLAASSSLAVNPYASWISSYTSPKFRQSVEKMITIYDQVAENASDIVREEMLKTSSLTTSMELNFWDEAYKLKAIDNIIE